VLGFAPILTAIALLFRQHILDYFVARVGEHEERPAQILTILLGSALGVFVTLMGRSQRLRGHGLARAAASDRILLIRRYARRPFDRSPRWRDIPGRRSRKGSVVSS
jgi:hypothetical protein